jgi:hypothetical protein
VELFGRLQTDCGYTPAQIRELTLDDVNRLFSHWGKYPPVRDLVAVAVGFDIPTDEPEMQPMTAEEFRRMFEITGGRIEGVS